MVCNAIVLGVVIVVHALESEIENGRMHVYRSEELVEWKNGMKAVLVEWKFQFLHWKFSL